MRKPKPKRKQIYKKKHCNSLGWDEVKTSDTGISVEVVGCTGKHRYPDLISAHAAAHHMIVLKGDSEVYLYLCDHCGGYHLTKSKISPKGELNRWACFFGRS